MPSQQCQVFVAQWYARACCEQHTEVGAVVPGESERAAPQCLQNDTASPVHGRAEEEDELVRVGVVGMGPWMVSRAQVSW